MQKVIIFLNLKPVNIKAVHFLSREIIRNWDILQEVGPSKKPEGWKKKKFEEEEKEKIPVVAFGDGMFNKDGVKIQGLRHGVTNILWRALKRRQPFSPLVLGSVDEFRTSRVCRSCSEISLTTVSITCLPSVLACQSCGMMWNRDTNAAKNIHYLSHQLLSGHPRPAPFLRPPHQ